LGFLDFVNLEEIVDGDGALLRLLGKECGREKY
jgi:hypothetical protein